MRGTKTKIISKVEFYSLVGMVTLANKLWSRINLLEEEFGDILNLEGEDNYDKGGYILMDNLSEKDIVNTLKKALKVENIGIKK